MKVRSDFGFLTDDVVELERIVPAVVEFVAFGHVRARVGIVHHGNWDFIINKPRNGEPYDAVIHAFIKK